MAISFSGRPPLVAVPTNNFSQTDPVTPNVDAIKGVLVARLAEIKGQLSASEQIAESEIHLIDDVLQIKVGVSNRMLPVVINAEAERIMNATLREYRLSGIRIKLVSSQSTTNTKKTATHSVSTNVIDASFKKLSNSAAKLNEISDKLSKQVEQIDAALKRLNLGVTAWVVIKEEEDEDGNCYGEHVGYGKIGNRWGVVLKTYYGMRGDPSRPDENLWAFADAPRQMRIRAVQHITTLLEVLSAEADKMIEQLEPRVDELADVTSALISSEGGR